MLKNLRLILWLILGLTLSWSSLSESNTPKKVLMPVDKAFQLSVSTQENQITLHYIIAKGYYLYQEKFTIATDSNLPIGRLQFPVAQIENDDFFGKVGVYRDSVDIIIPIGQNKQKQLNLVINYQGCSDLGVCHPVIVKNLRIKLKPSSNKTTQTNLLSDMNNIALSFGKNLFDKITNFNQDIHPLRPEEAFSPNIEQKDNSSVLVSWSIKPDYYLYQNKFSFQVKNATLGKVILPQGQTKKDPIFGTVVVLHNYAEVVLPLSDINPSKTIEVIANYQGCWEGGVCYPPQKIQQSIQLTKMDIASLNNNIQKKTSQNNNNINIELTAEQNISWLLNHKSILWVLLSFFGFGLLLSLTPCVFPMIPILSGIIIGQKSHTSTYYALAISIIFVLAMALVYAIAGIIAGWGGHNLQILFQTPWILASFSGVFVLLSLSMFGYFDIQMPKYLQNKLGRMMNNKKSGLFSAGVMGALSALIVGPCVAPPLAGALIYIGQTGDAFLGGLALFVMGIGMGVPLILIGASAGKLLPKAGVWMDKIKAIFGILMLAVAIYLLERIISPTYSLLLWALLLIFSPAAMGVFKTLTPKATSWHGMFKAIGLVLFGVGLLVLLNVLGRIAPDIIPSFTNTAQVQKSKLAFKQINNLSDLNNALTLAENNNQIAMLDFYADWCISCKVIEKKLFSNAQTQNKLNTFLLLKADVTKYNRHHKALLKKFNIIGPPAILFFKQQKELISSRITQEISVDEFLNKINKL